MSKLTKKGAITYGFSGRYNRQSMLKQIFGETHLMEMPKKRVEFTPEQIVLQNKFKTAVQNAQTRYIDPTKVSVDMAAFKKQKKYKTRWNMIVQEERKKL